MVMQLPHEEGRSGLIKPYGGCNVGYIDVMRDMKIYLLMT